MKNRILKTITVISLFTLLLGVGGLYIKATWLYWWIMTVSIIWIMAFSVANDWHWVSGSEGGWE